ncbi:AraC family transcriptional regulator [Mucilaginibacter myungsuensis]|uniref:Helix-turn-helix domain-containing protein n=1 Tax=Mucilaginibacter myungsuensis TaxID=649104 RepID=A0A929KYR2_9SPHI|nr:helix-turn-helix transcriptional regulator [Mucilaginibacter myungsuensis]MBE9662923.1 helix-turn-helix domain-containing protein [Mucilaginibacter myungsuensis]MDN3598545.1 helix-turn-helix transcriptional regulator [Mucilaginibacter myungsuensis]
MNKRFPVYDICSLSDAQDEDILVSRFAPYLQVHQNLKLPHKHNFYHLVLFTEGGGTHAIDFEQYPVLPYQIYFMIPGQAHSWSFEEHVDGYVINFSVPFLESFLLKHDHLEQYSFFNGIPDRSVINIPEAFRASIIDLFENILQEAAQPQQQTTDMVRTLLLQLFIKVGRIVGPRQTPSVTGYNYTLLKNFQKLVEANYHILKLPKQYAELLFITPNHLNALSNNLLQKPAGEVIRERVALEAKRLLINFDLTITEIAQRLNFADNSYFSKFFKKQAGLSPEEFRNKIKNATI